MTPTGNKEQIPNPPTVVLDQSADDVTDVINPSSLEYVRILAGDDDIKISITLAPTAINAAFTLKSGTVEWWNCPIGFKIGIFNGSAEISY